MIHRAHVAHVLFFDMREMDRLDDVRRIVNPMVKHPANPVLRPGPPGTWDSVRAKAYGTILYDKDARLFSMWYSGADGTPPHTRNIGYAESRDGVHWKKPVLRAVEHPHYGRQHNMVVLNGQFLSVVERADAPCRYVAMWSPGGPTLGRNLGWSEDGIHWTHYEYNPVIRPTNPQGDWLEPTSLLYDPDERDPQRRWKTYGQRWIRAPLKSNTKNTRYIRTVGLHMSPDLIHWTEWPTPVLDPADGIEDQIHMGYVTKYHGHYVMLYDFMYADSSCDCELATSRDGVHFERICNGSKVLPLGDEHAWDSSNLNLSNGFLIHQGRIWLYYVGSPENYAEGPWPPDAHEHRWHRYTGLALHRLDGFTSLDLVPGASEGSALTQPFLMGAEPWQVWVNADVPYRSALTVEVIDASSGMPLSGYTHAECAPTAGNRLRHLVGWREHHAVATPHAVRLRFHWSGPGKLYAFGCENAEEADE